MPGAGRLQGLPLDPQLKHGYTWTKITSGWVLGSTDAGHSQPPRGNLLLKTSSTSVLGHSSFASVRSEEISFYCCLNVVVISELCSHNNPMWLISFFFKPISSKDLIKQAETYLPPPVWPWPYYGWCLQKLRWGNVVLDNTSCKTAGTTTSLFRGGTELPRIM